MNLIRYILLALFTVLVACQHVVAQGTAFTYQGRLNSSGVAASGNYDFSFTLYAAPTGGSAVAGPVTTNAVGVTNGLFAVTVDFGSSFPAANRWLEIGVRTNGGGSFTTLGQRQQLTPAPYAVLSENASVANSVAAANITGQLLNSTLPTNPNFTGTVTASGYSGNGASLTNIPESGINTSGTLGLITNSLSYSYGGFQAIGSGASYYYYSNPNIGFMALATNLNGLGHVDVLVADVFSNAVVVATNNGAGIFSSNASYLIGGSPSWIAVLDVNNDGKPDFVAANYAASNLVVFTNSGSGFVSNTSLTVGAFPSCVVAFDVNNDSKLDLIAANYGSNSVTIYTNNTHGGFASNVSYAVGSAPVCIAVADMNNDSKKDLIVANSGTNTLSILFNSGNGTFLPAETVVACNSNTSPKAVVAADFNADGYNDLITVNADGTFSVLTNNGNGSFTLVSTNTASGNVKAISVADVNGDGLPDLVVGCDNNEIAVLFNTGNATFGPGLSFSPPGTYGGSYYTSVAAVDLNGDGRLDLIAFSGFDVDYYYYSNDELVEYLNTGPVLTSALTLAGENGGIHLSPGLNGYANIVNGATGNQVDPTVTGSDISGGGTSNFLGAISYNHISADFSDIGGGSGNTIQAGADHSAISGGWANTIGVYAYESVVAGGNNNVNNGQYSVIGGGNNNKILASSIDVTIAGGANNTAGGSYNGADAVGGGYGNSATGGDSTVAGGYQNQALNYYATVGGGYYNVAAGNSSFVAGEDNHANGLASVVPGGYNNTAGGQYSFAAGYSAQALHDGAFVWADSQNSAFNSTTNNEFSIRAQNGVRIQSTTGIHLDAENTPIIVRDWDVFASNAPAGKSGNGRWGLFMEPDYLTLGIPSNDVSARFFQVAKYSTNGSPTTLMQVDQTGQVSATGGFRMDDKPLYLRGGGDTNHGLAYCGFTITNFLPTVLPDGPVLWGFSGGALGTYAGNNAVLNWTSTGVTITPGTTGQSLYVSGRWTGGWPNPVALIENLSTATNASPALRLLVDGGRTPDGALSVSANVSSSSSNCIIAEFGNSGAFVCIITNDGSIFSSGNIFAQGNLTNNGSVFTAGDVFARGIKLTSDRNAKENFTSLDSRAVLEKVAALPVSEWNYKNDSAQNRHIGPVAQDFQAAFGLDGADDKHISVVDESGVALAAIKGLNQKVEELSANLKQRDAENAELKARLEVLEKLVRNRN